MNKEMDQEFEARVEDYEEALMRMLIYDVAKEDGEHLLAEAEELKHSGFEVPKELDERCLRLIRDASNETHSVRQPLGAGAGEGRPSPAPRFRFRKVGEILAAAILAAALLFSVAYATNEQFRVNVLNFFLEVRENGTQFFFGSGETGSAEPMLSQASSTDGDFPFEFTYIPEGYEQIKQETMDYGNGRTAFLNRYSCSYDEYSNFYFEIVPISDGASLFVDTEDASVTETNIRGYDGWLIEKTDSISSQNAIMYLWFDMENHERFCYFSLGISATESQQIFDGIAIDEQMLKSLSNTAAHTY